MGRPETLVAELRQSIRDLAAIALQPEGRNDPERGSRLKSAVRSHLVARAKEHGVTRDDAVICDLLAVDSDLNDQGLEVWLKRREKRAAAGREGLEVARACQVATWQSTGNGRSGWADRDRLHFLMPRRCRRGASRVLELGRW